MTRRPILVPLAPLVVNGRRVDFPPPLPAEHYRPTEEPFVMPLRPGPKP